jgi:hypothetical protein
MAKFVTLLGFAAAADGTRLAESLAAVAGPPVCCIYASGLAALAQAAPTATRWRRPDAKTTLLGLRSIQQRLEAACAIAPFLPADPAHAHCANADIATLLAAAAPAIAAALAGPGTRHQWDVVLRWQPEAVVAAQRTNIADRAAAGGGSRAALGEAVAAVLAAERERRESALRAALGRTALALRTAGAGPAEIGITVLLPAGADTVLEAALQSLPADITADAEADLRGPLPPVSFAAVRIDRAAPAAVADAWHNLALPARIDAGSLHRHWRDCAARLHPDRGTTDSSPMQQAGAAFRLLRDLLPSGPDEKPWSLPALQRHAACRMKVQTPDAVETVP